jgi:hypothetical protein
LEDNSLNFYVFEPHGLLQKMGALFQNSFEILIFIAVLVLSLYKPSFVSVTFLALGHSILIPTSLEATSRMFWGRIISILLILLLLIEMIVKWRNLTTEHSAWDTQKNNHKKMRWYMGFGYYIDLMEDKEKDLYSFGIHKYRSFTYEGYVLGLLIIYLVLCSYYNNKLCTLLEK